MRKVVNAASDARVVNNVVRHEYRVLSDPEKEQMRQIKDMGRDSVEACQAIGESPEMDQAVINARQAVMWAVNHITR